MAKKDRQWRPDRQLVAGGVLVTVSILVTCFLAFRGASDSPPDGLEAASLAILAGVFNALGVAVASKTSEPPNRLHVRSAARRVTQIGLFAQRAEIRAQEALEDGHLYSDRTALGQASVDLSTIQELASDALADWKDLLADAIDDGTDDAEAAS